MIRQKAICWNCGQDAIVDEDFICNACQSKAGSIIRYGGDHGGNMGNPGNMNVVPGLIIGCKHEIFEPGKLTGCGLKWDEYLNDFDYCEYDNKSLCKHCPDYKAGTNATTSKEVR